MQAIRTKYFGPTNFRGARIKASCQAKSITVPYDHALNPAGNNKAAAKALAEAMDWNFAAWVPGDLPDGSTVFVCVVNDAISDGFVL